MSGYFSPYEGKKPYVFISYSHQDSDRVLNVISPMHNQYYRVWYDEGVPAGCDWPDNIARHMRDSSAVLFFVSVSSLASINCLNEITAAKQQKKPILSVRLDDTVLPDEWVPLIEKTILVAPLQHNAIPLDQQILNQGMITSDFLGDGTNDPVDDTGGVHFNVWTLIAILGSLLFVLTMVGTYGLANHWFDECLPQQRSSVGEIESTPHPTTVPTAAPTLDLSGPWIGILSEYAAFPDEQQERAIRNALDQPDGDVLSSDLLNITQLYFCGNMVLTSDAGIAFDSDGNCSVNGAPVIQGSISDLSLIDQMLALERLSIVCQQIESIDSLATLTLLTELNAAGNPIETIGDLSSMRALQKLHLEHTDIQDLSSLYALPNLQTVTVSADMFPLIMDAQTQDFDVVLTD